jgi:hypothetical protein
MRLRVTRGRAEVSILRLVTLLSGWCHSDGAEVCSASVVYLSVSAASAWRRCSSLLRDSPGTPARRDSAKNAAISMYLAWLIYCTVTLFQFVNLSRVGYKAARCGCRTRYRARGSPHAPALIPRQFYLPLPLYDTPCPPVDVGVKGTRFSTSTPTLRRDSLWQQLRPRQ